MVDDSLSRWVWLIVKCFVLWITILFIQICAISPVYGFTVHQTEYDTLELRSKMDRGLLVTEYEQRNVRDKNWVYFCVVDRHHLKVHSPERCFYGDGELFTNVGRRQVILGVEFSVNGKFRNDRRLITIGSNRTFYPAGVVR